MSSIHDEIVESITEALDVCSESLPDLEIGWSRYCIRSQTHNIIAYMHIANSLLILANDPYGDVDKTDIIYDLNDPDLIDALIDEFADINVLRLKLWPKLYDQQDK